jgi:hypothetical protein
MVAEREQVKIACFKNTKEFFEVAENIDFKTPIYIDYYLEKEIQNNKTGDELAKDIFESGFEEIYLASGVHPDTIKLSTMPWISGIRGKETPFSELL